MGLYLALLRLKPDNPKSFIFSDKLWQDVDPKDFACKPDIRVPQSVVFSQPGANVTLSCFIIGNPMPDAKWVLKVGFIFFISCIYRILTKNVVAKHISIIFSNLIKRAPIFKNLDLEEAALEEAMQLRRLIKSSNESLGPYLFGKIEFWNF